MQVGDIIYIHISMSPSRINHLAVCHVLIVRLAQTSAGGGRKQSDHRKRRKYIRNEIQRLFDGSVVFLSSTDLVDPAAAMFRQKLHQSLRELCQILLETKFET